MDEFGDRSLVRRPGLRLALLAGIAAFTVVGGIVAAARAPEVLAVLQVLLSS